RLNLRLSYADVPCPLHTGSQPLIISHTSRYQEDKVLSNDTRSQFTTNCPSFPTTTPLISTACPPFATDFTFVSVAFPSVYASPRASNDATAGIPALPAKSIPGSHDSDASCRGHVNRRSRLPKREWCDSRLAAFPDFALDTLPSTAVVCHAKRAHQLADIGR